MQKTRFGWILAGRFGSPSNFYQNVQSFHANVTDVQLHDSLSRFWEIEELGELNNYTIEEAQCEIHFLKNVTRTQEGRFIIKLSFKEQVIDIIGNSRDIALKRFYGLERRFKRNPQLKKQYVQFLNEYCSLGHMKEVSNVDDCGQDFYLPHHGFQKHATSIQNSRSIRRVK